MDLIQHPHVSRNFLCAEAEDEETILSEHAKNYKRQTMSNVKICSKLDLEKYLRTLFVVMGKKQSKFT